MLCIMKKLLALFTTAFIMSLTVFGQAPGLFNYQGVARNSVGNVLQNKAITLRLSIHDLTATGTTVYSETRSLTTNPFGLFNVQVGSTGATNVTGTIAAVNWGTGAKFIQVEIDPNGGNTFINIGTAQLASVPYALNAASSGSLALPFSATQADPGVLFRLTNSGAGEAINGISTGTGRGGYFQVNNAASTADALRAETNGTGASWAFRGISTGTNGAGLFVQSNVTNTSNNLQSNQAGLGRAGLFNSTNAASTANAVDVNVAGTGWALQASSTNAVPRALRTVGAIQLTGLGEAAGRILTTDAAGNAVWAVPAPAGSLVLPYTANENSAVDLFTINNAGTGTSLVGTNGSTTASISAIRGVVTSTTPGGFASAIRGINSGTGGLGIGIWGSQGGSGWGVYGSTPNGLGVYGNSSAAGYGVFGNSTSGVGVYGTSNDGTPGNFVISNNTNVNAALLASTISDGVAIEGTTSSTTSSVAAIRGIISSTTPGGFSSAIRGINSGTGGLGVGVWGSQAGSGWGVYGAAPDGLGVYGNSSGGGVGVYANSNTGTGLSATSNNGIAASFMISNNANNSNVVNANSSGGGTIINVNSTGTGKGVFSSTGAGFAVHGVTTSVSSAGIIGDNNGGGEAVVGRNNSDIAGAVVGRNDGGGYGVRGFIGSNTDGTAVGVLGQIGIGGSTGRAGRFENNNATNIVNAFEVVTNGNGNIPDRTQGNAANFLVNNANSVAGAVRGQVNTIFGNFGAAAIFGESTGTGGFAGLFYSSNAAGNGPALVALADGNGNAITANADNGGDGVETTVDGSGNALYAWTPTFSTGRAARLVNYNSGNANSVLTVETHSAGDIAVFKAGDPATTNVARIDATGRGFFNGGTQNSGADIAEAFDVEGNPNQYEAGDILVISTDKDRAVEKSSTPYSTLVAGVYATKPGVLLTEEHIDSKLEGKVPMGVVGVIPTKVCLEGGAIKRGDMLVTSSIPGVAMKADPDKVKIGQVLGKALQDYTAATVGKINVLVNVK
jgi:hypothetical protein